MKGTRFLTAMITVGLLSATSIAVASHGFSVVVDRSDVTSRVHRIEGQLDRMQRINRRNADDQQRRKMRRAIREVQQDLSDLRALVDNADAPRQRRHRDRRRGSSYAPAPMNNQEFARFYSELQRTTFTSSKRDLVSDVMQNAYVTSDQVARVMGLLSFSSDKVAVAAIMYPSVVDPQNFYTVYGQLTFDSDRKKLRRMIASP